MTVHELIVKLKGIDPDMQVLIADKTYGGYHRATMIDTIKVVADDNKFFDYEDSGLPPQKAIILL